MSSPRALHLTTAALLLAILAGPALGDEDYREKRRDIEVVFARRYVKLAKEAKRLRHQPMLTATLERAEELDPGNDDVIEFERTIAKEPTSALRRRFGKLEAKVARLRSDEAKRRLALALWCDEEALPDEAVAEAVEALRLSTAVGFDERGALVSAELGELPLSLSLGVLDEHEVLGGVLVRREDVPNRVSWSRGWKLETEHFLIRTNVSGDLCRTVGRALEAAREVYREETGFDVEKRITVFITRTRKAYEEMWVKAGRERPGEDNRGKCYGDFCGVDGSKTTDTVISTAIHEVAHGYYNLGHEALTKKKGVRMPTWFAEGLATYCAGYGVGSLSFADGVVVPESARAEPLARFREMVEKGEAMRLADFLAVEQGDGRFYLQAYAFYWFLREGGEGFTTRFRRAVKKMAAAGLTDDAVTRGNAIFLEEMNLPPDALEKCFYEWLAATADPTTVRAN